MVLQIKGIQEIIISTPASLRKDMKTSQPKVILETINHLEEMGTIISEKKVPFFILFHKNYSRN